MPEENHRPNPICLVLTVGAGGRNRNVPDPARALVRLIEARRPERFLLVTVRSRDSFQTAERVMEMLGRDLKPAFEPWSAQHAFQRIERPEDAECVRRTLADLLHSLQDRFPGLARVVNAGSGTRPMAAGAALAALDAGSTAVEFSLGPENPEPAKPGTTPRNARPESKPPPSRPAPVLDTARLRARQAAEVAQVLWNRLQLDGSAIVLESALSGLATSDRFVSRFTALRQAVAGFAAKEDSRIADAEAAFREALRHFQTDGPEPPAPWTELAAACRKAADRCGRFRQLQEGKRETKILREWHAEVMDHSLRASQVGRFEWAAERMWRAMAIDLRIRLGEATEGAIWNGRLRGRDAPAALRAPAFLASIQRTDPPREFSFEQMVHALHALGDTSLDALHQDLMLPRADSTFRAAFDLRHASVLAHGSGQVTKADFRNLRRAATRFLGLNPVESSPLPVFEASWLESC